MALHSWGLQLPSPGLDSKSPFTHLSAVPRSGVGLLCNLMIRIGGSLLLLNSTQVVPRSQHQSQRQDESALLRCKIVELNWNTNRLIAEAEKLIQESKQLSARIKSFETSSTKQK
jgi:hypothetical protein